MKASAEMIFDEIKMVNGICEKYFDRIYNNIGFTLTYYGVIIASCKDMTIPDDLQKMKLILVFLLPCVTYILGILYCNNVMQIEKTGYIQIKYEIHLNKLLLSDYKNDAGIEGWALYAKSDKISSFITYGVVLAAYILSPAVTMYYYRSLNPNLHVSPFVIFLMLIYAVYVFFMIILVKQIFAVRKDIKKLRNESSIDHPFHMWSTILEKVD